MSGYFERLAQRSGLAATPASAPQPAPVALDTSEETVATRQPANREPLAAPTAAAPSMPNPARVQAAESMETNSDQADMPPPMRASEVPAPVEIHAEPTRSAPLPKQSQAEVAALLLPAREPDVSPEPQTSLSPSDRMPAPFRETVLTQSAPDLAAPPAVSATGQDAAPQPRPAAGQAAQPQAAADFTIGHDPQTRPAKARPRPSAPVEPAFPGAVATPEAGTAAPFAQNGRGIEIRIGSISLEVVQPPAEPAAPVATPRDEPRRAVFSASRHYLRWG